MWKGRPGSSNPIKVNGDCDLEEADLVNYKVDMLLSGQQTEVPR